MMSLKNAVFSSFRSCQNVLILALISHHQIYKQDANTYPNPNF